MWIGVDKKDAILKFTIIIEEKMKFSLNKVWAGWASTPWIRKKAADLWHDEIWYYLEENKIKKIDEKVDFYFEFFFKTRALDSSNCSAMGKMIEDGLKYDKNKNKKWILVDDTNSQVGKFLLESVKLDKKQKEKIEEDYVDIYIFKNNI